MNFGFTAAIAAMQAFDTFENESSYNQDDRWADLEKSDNNKGGFGCFLVSLLFLGLLGWGVYSMGLVSDPYERTEMCTTTVEHVEKRQVTTTVYQTDNIRSGETDWTVTQ